MTRFFLQTRYKIVLCSWGQTESRRGRASLNSFDWRVSGPLLTWPWWEQGGQRAQTNSKQKLVPVPRSGLTHPATRTGQLQLLQGTCTQLPFCHAHPAVGIKIPQFWQSKARRSPRAQNNRQSGILHVGNSPQTTPSVVSGKFSGCYFKLARIFHHVNKHSSTCLEKLYHWEWSYHCHLQEMAPLWPVIAKETWV